ncbi:MAG: hypothetical protein ACXVHY_05845 [Methanobacterium sp.]
MDEFKTIVLGSFFIVVLTLIYNLILVFIGGNEFIIKYSVFSIFLVLIISFLVGFKLNEEFRTSLLYGILLGFIYITTDALIKGIFGLKDFNLSFKYIVLYMILFAALCGLGSRAGMVKKALDEIKSEKEDGKT